MSRAKLGKSAADPVVCADCGAHDPSWASLNRGILICDECCSIHRTLGRHVSHVKSVKKASWSPTQLAMVYNLYSSGANAIWEYALHDPSSSKSVKRKPQPKDPLKPIKADFIRAKHQMLAYVFRPSKEDHPTNNNEDDISQQLHSCVRTASIDTSLRLLAQGADPNYFHPNKGTCPLHVAASAGQISQVELLLVYGGDPAFPDAQGKTPVTHAKEAGLNDLAERLIESQYELTDRLSFFLCGRKPDHSHGQHYMIPEKADGVDLTSEYAKAARKKLKELPNNLFEELAMDLYDDIDRRETESVWLASQNPHLSPAERCNVPFLPVNPELSTTRNQGRQKLARFNARELAILVIDVLTEAKRRQFSGNVQSGLIVRKSEVSDDEPLYDSVASEDDYAVPEQKPNYIISPSSSEKSGVVPNAISVDTYLDIKQQLCLSNSRMQELLSSNTNMQQQISLLQTLVQKLVEENAQLKNNMSNGYDSVPSAPTPSRPESKNVQPASLQQVKTKTNTGTSHAPFPNFPEVRGTGTSSSGEDSVTLRSPRTSQRPFSMYETREGCRSAATRPMQTTSSIPGTSYGSFNDTARPGPSRGGAVSSGTSTHSSASTPTLDDIIRKTEWITKRIQELMKNVQEKRMDHIDMCAERIETAVSAMASLFQNTPPDDPARAVVQQLRGSAARLRQECRYLSREPTEQAMANSNQPVFHWAYEIAKAAKQLMIFYQ